MLPLLGRGILIYCNLICQLLALFPELFKSFFRKSLPMSVSPRIFHYFRVLGFALKSIWNRFLYREKGGVNFIPLHADVQFLKQHFSNV